MGFWSLVPAAKAARRSSLPKVLTIPMVKSASAKYCATYDSRSMNPFRYDIFISLQNSTPVEMRSV